MKLLLALNLLFLISCSQGAVKRYPANIERKDFYEVGDIKASLLQPHQFYERYSENWALMDGKEGESIEKSEFSITTGIKKLPDARGKFLRMNNNGVNCEDKNDCQYDPDNTALGDKQSDDFKEHKHTIEAKAMDRNGDWGHVTRGWNSGHQKGPVQTNPSGGFETRPKNISVNYYIKINSCGDEEQCR